MKDEIKEILDIFTKYKDDWYSVEYILKPKQCVALYDYITNLQKENKKYKEILDKIKEYIPKLRRTPSYELDEKLDDILELLEEIE